ncbi:MAG: LamG-like jellyroll fold domain-containing protein [Planctomycetota bacterium]
MPSSVLWSRFRWLLIAVLAVVLAQPSTAEVYTLLHAGLGEAGGETKAAVRLGPEAGWTSIGELETTNDVADRAARATDSKASLSFSGDGGLTLRPLEATPQRHVGIEAWVRPRSQGGARTLINLGGNGGIGIEQHRDGVWGVVYGCGTVGFTNVELDRWTHVALVVDDATSTLYIDGRETARAELVPWGYAPGAGLGIGVKADGKKNHFDGDIDEVRVFTFEPGSFSEADLLFHQDRADADRTHSHDARESSSVVEASIIFDATPVENGLSFERSGTKPVRRAGKQGWSAFQTMSPEMQWMRSFRLTFTDERFRHGNMPVVDVEIEFLLDTWGGLVAMADTEAGSQRVVHQWGASPRWKTARFKLDNAYFGARDHGTPGNKLRSDGYDLRIYGPNVPLLIRSVKVRGYPLEGEDLAWDRLVKVERPVSVNGPILAFEAEPDQGLRFEVNNHAKDDLRSSYRLQILGPDETTVAEQRGEVVVPGQGVSTLDTPFNAEGWAYGPYRYRFTLERADAQLPLAEYEGGIIVHDGEPVERARPGGFLYGVQHTRSFDTGIDPAWFNLLGVDFIRGMPLFVPRTNFDTYERFIPKLSSMGMSALVMIDPPKPGDPRTYIPEGMDPQRRERELKRLESFLETLAAKYRNEITYYELGNEPDLKFFYPGPVSEYVDSFKRMRAAIKRGNPDAVVMTGGLCFFREEGDTRAREIIRLVGADGVDAWSFHAHGPGYESQRDMYEKIRQAVIENAPGGEHLPFIETESGFSAVGTAQLREQARSCIEKFVYAQSVGIPKFAWFATHFEGNSTYTSVENLREPRPVMLAYRTLVQRLRHYDFQQAMTFADGRVKAYHFHRSDTGRSALVLFSTATGVSQPVRVELGSVVGGVTAYDMWNNPSSVAVDTHGVADLMIGEDSVFLDWVPADDASIPGERPPLLRVTDQLVLPHVRHTPKVGVSINNPGDQAAEFTASGQIVLAGQSSPIHPRTLTLEAGASDQTVLEGESVVGPALVKWPKVWRVFTDRHNRESTRDLDLGGFSTIPRQIGNIEGRWVAVSDDDRIDLGAIAGGYQEKAPALLFAEVWSSVDQTVQVGAAADWWMQWAVNGQTVYDTLEGGNAGAQTIAAHTFNVPLKAGVNLLAVRVLSGSGAWAFVTGGPQAVDGALHPERPEHRIELTLAKDGQAIAELTLPVADPMTAAPIGARGLPSAPFGWLVRQPLASLGEREVINPHLVQPDQSRWWAGPQDASALVWAQMDGTHLVFAVQVLDQDHVPGQDGIELSLRGPGLSPSSGADTAAWSVRIDASNARSSFNGARDATTPSVVRDDASGATWYLLRVPVSALDHPAAAICSLTVFDDDGWGAKQQLVAARLGDRPLTLIPQASADTEVRP